MVALLIFITLQHPGNICIWKRPQDEIAAWGVIHCHSPDWCTWELWEGVFEQVQPRRLESEIAFLVSGFSHYLASWGISFIIQCPFLEPGVCSRVAVVSNGAMIIEHPLVPNIWLGTVKALSCLVFIEKS